MEKTNCTDDEISSELLHAYAKNDGSCPNTWSRESEEWQFDGVAQTELETSEAPAGEASIKVKSAKNNFGQSVRPSELQKELSNWLPAT